MREILRLLLSEVELETHIRTKAPRKAAVYAFPAAVHEDVEFAVFLPLPLLQPFLPLALARFLLPLPAQLLLPLLNCPSLPFLRLFPFPFPLLLRLPLQP